MDPIAAFTSAMQAAGIEPPEVTADGKLHRFPTNGQRGDNSGWYVLHGDGLPAGSFGCWRAGINETWCAKSDGEFSADERREFAQRMKSQRRVRNVEERRCHANAAKRAAEIWNEAEPGEHDYLTAKRIGTHGVRIHKGSLVVPMRDVNGDLASLQFIQSDGRKRFLTGGKVSGCYHAIGKLDEVLCIAEGYATAATIHEATGYAVACAFTAGNLKHVAQTLRKKFPDSKLIVCADNDTQTAGNPGVTKGAQAAKAVRAHLAVPNSGDFNDLYTAEGSKAVRAAIEAATRPNGGSPHTVSLLRGDAVRPEAIHWLWHGWLARGKLHIVAGAPGCGKSTLAIALAATLTSGGRWPDGTTCMPGNVIVWTGEDGIADTLHPRFIGMGGDRSRIWFVDGITDHDGNRPFDPAQDTGALLTAAQRIGDVGLLIVDPIVSAVSGDSHKNTETRRSLQPLVDVGAALDAAVLGISHYTKGTQGRDPIERVTGSIAFGALPRIIFGAAKSTDDDGPERLFVRAKSNIGPDGGGFGYELRQSVLDAYPDIITSGVYWGDELEGTARDLLGVAEATDDGRSELDDATDWLKAVLAEGRVATTELQRLAKQAGHAWRTVERAKKRAKAVSDREGFGRHSTWYWLLPKDRQDIDRQRSPQDLAAYAETRMNKGIERRENSKNPHRPPTDRGGEVCADDADSEAF